VLYVEEAHIWEVAGDSPESKYSAVAKCSDRRIHGEDRADLWQGSKPWWRLIWKFMIDAADNVE
jgi:hypothetical protein